jgi:hypothetical protein
MLFFLGFFFFFVLFCLGKIIADTKVELENIVDHFNIQVSNPVAILMQDTSKTFLADSREDTKYKVFIITIIYFPFFFFFWF